MTPVELEKAAASETVAWAHDDLDLAYSEIGLAVDANERTVRRWQSREVAPRGRHRAKLEDLRELRHLLQAVFESKADADRWHDISPEVLVGDSARDLASCRAIARRHVLQGSYRAILTPSAPLPGAVNLMIYVESWLRNPAPSRPAARGRPRGPSASCARR